MEDITQEEVVASFYEYQEWGIDPIQAMAEDYDLSYEEAKELLRKYNLI